MTTLHAPLDKIDHYVRHYIGSCLSDEDLEDIHETTTNGVFADQMYFYVLTDAAPAVAEALGESLDGVLADQDEQEDQWAHVSYRDSLEDGFNAAARALTNESKPRHYHFGGVGVAVGDEVESYAYPTISTVMAEYPGNVTWVTPPPLYMVSFAPATERRGVGGFVWSHSQEEAFSAFLSEVMESKQDDDGMIVRLLRVACPVDNYQGTDVQREDVTVFFDTGIDALEVTGHALIQFVPSTANPDWLPEGGALVQIL